MNFPGANHHNRRRDQRGFAVAEIMDVVLMLYVFVTGHPKVHEVVAGRFVQLSSRIGIRCGRFQGHSGQSQAEGQQGDSGQSLGRGPVSSI